MSENVPDSIEQIVAEFDAREGPIRLHELGGLLGDARSALGELSTDAAMLAWADHLAVSLATSDFGSSPWGTYFSPMGSGTNKEGKTVYYPEVRQADAAVLKVWERRAAELRRPELRARYADLCWDLASLIADKRPDVAMARRAADAYILIEREDDDHGHHDWLRCAIRSLDIAVSIRDAERTEAARRALLDRHRLVLLLEGKGFWWLAFDRLISTRNAGLSEEERLGLVADLEAIVEEHREGKKFDPHTVESAADRLISYYRRQKADDDVRRLHRVKAAAFQKHANRSTPSLAAAFLQNVVDSLNAAGDRDDARRARRAMEEQISRSHEDMQKIEFTQEIKREDMDAFLAQLVDDQLGNSLVRIALEFLPRRQSVEKDMRELAETAPLSALIPVSILAGDHVAATIGGLDEDATGRTIQEYARRFQLTHIWLILGFRRLLETHDLHPQLLAAFINRHGSFRDMSFLIEGLRAWLLGDFVKALHVLIPQVEAGLRQIAEDLEQPRTKAHPKKAGAGLALNMGDILNSSDLAPLLGEDLRTFLLALYADARGMNLRNLVCHGLFEAEHVNEFIVLLVVHSLLVLALWKEIREREMKTQAAQSASAEGAVEEIDGPAPIVAG